MANYIHSDLTGMVIEAFYNVYNKLGYGFLERVYENAMMIELKKLGLERSNQHAINVYYDDEEVGDFFADILVQNTVILELKAAKKINEEHEAQLLNYLKATEVEVGLILNFGPKPQVSRKIFENKYK